MTRKPTGPADDEVADPADPAADPSAGPAEEAVDDPADEVVADDDAATGPRWTRWVVVAAATAVVAVFAGTAALGWLWFEQRESQRAARDGLAAAQQFIGVLTNIDGAKLDANFAAAADGSTGEFKDKYAQSSAELRKLLVDNKASAHGFVVDSAVKSASPDRVVVLLFVDQSVTNSAAPEPRLDRSRIRVTMQRVDDRWLASKVELP